VCVTATQEAGKKQDCLPVSKRDIIFTFMNHTTSIGNSTFLHAVTPCKGKINGWESLSDGMLFDPTGRILVATLKGTLPEDVIIPEGVEVIADHAFGWRQRLRSVSFPASLKRIEGGAFFACKGLEEIRIAHDEFSTAGMVFNCSLWFDRQPPGVVYLGNFALDCHGETSGELRIREGTKRVVIPKWSSNISGCNLRGIKKVVLPASVTFFQTTVINDGPTLMSCRSLEEYEVSPDNQQYSSCDGLLYDKAGRRLLLCPAARRVIRIPEHVKEIAKDAFHYTYQVKELHVPERLQARYPKRLTLKNVNIGPGWEILSDDE